MAISKGIARACRLCAVVTAIVLTAAACSLGAGTEASGSADPGLPAKLRVGLIPNIAPEEQQAKYQPLDDYLTKTLRLDVDLFVASDYAGVVAALAGGRIDIAYLGGLTYVQAEQQVELLPLVTEIDALTGTSEYDSAVVVREDSPLRSLSDIVKQGASFAFGDPASTSGSLYPRSMLADEGVNCDTVDLTKCPPLKSVLFTGGHDATAQSVLSGSVDAGGLELRILRRLEKEGKVPAGALRVVQTARVPGYPWVGRAALGPTALGQIADAFTAINDASLLDLLRAQSYVKIKASDYESVRTQATRLGLLAPS